MARRAAYLVEAEAHLCRPGTAPRVLTPDELQRPLNSNRSPDTVINASLKLPVGSEWQCECGRRWLLEWDSAARLENWRPL